MPAQNEVRWLLDRIEQNWPDGAFRSDIVRIDEDEPEVLETGRRSASVELSNFIAIRAGEFSRSRDPQGAEFNYEIETDLSVTIEAVHADEFGQVDSAREFRGVINKTLNAINQARTYPAVEPTSDPVGRIKYLDAQIADQSTPPEARQAANFFAEELTVRLRGRKELP